MGYIGTFPANTTTVMGIPIGKLNDLNNRVKALEAGGGGVGAWKTPIEAVAADGSVTIFTVGSSAPTDVIADGTSYFSGQGYTFAAGQITFNIGGGGPTQFVRYR